jgi:hypothetical protein
MMMPVFLTVRALSRSMMRPVMLGGLSTFLGVTALAFYPAQPYRMYVVAAGASADSC